ncbi:hypothetical protein OROGR_018094 [Orobanche gracilis]
MEHRRKPIPEAIQRRLSKLFVTNLPEGCSGSDLASHVRSFGQIFDIYIARKKDKGGNRFGFISMLDVRDRSELLNNLRNIRMGESKLWFNIARFVLEDGEINVIREDKKAEKASKPYARYGMDQSGSKFEAGGRSFRDMLAGKTITIDDKVNGFSTLHVRAIVGRMKDVEAVKSIFLFLNNICPGSGKVQYLGGLDLLISFEVAELATIVFEAAKNDMDNFSAVCMWKGQSFSYEMLAWVKVQGIPLHLFSHDVINLVGSSFGKVVHKAVKLDADVDLSYDYVGILVGDGKKLSEEVILEWKSRKFRVWINEEMGDWIPEFYPVTQVPIDDQMTNEVPPAVDVETEAVVTDVEMPECQPEQRSGEEAKGNNGNVVLESNKCNNNDGNAFQSSNFMVQDLNIEEPIPDFVPAMIFDFENSALVGSVGTVNPKISKRKKGKKNDMGRPSSTFVSSNESQRLGKKPKQKSSDLFGLNGLLGINDSPSSVSEGSDSEDEESFDLNSNPILSTRVNRDSADLGDSVHSKVTQCRTEDLEDADVNLQAKEVAATKSLGFKLGVDLKKQDKLIMDSIITEGLQTGIK